MDSSQRGVARTHGAFLETDSLRNLVRKLTFSQRAGLVGVDVLRLGLLTPRHGATIGSKELQTIFLPFFKQILRLGKISPSSRNAHVNVIIIINNALRFITVL